MKNPLHTLAASADIPANRMTGRSTAIALNLLSQAIKNPHTKIKITNHHPTADADHHLATMMVDMVSRLDLKFIIFYRGNREYHVSFGDVKDHK